MAMDMIFLSALLVTVFILLLTIRDSRRYNSKGQLPPGPTPFPILGNVLDVPRSRVGFTFSALRKKYGESNLAFPMAEEVPLTSYIGDVIYLNLLGQPMVVIGSVTAAFDLLDKKSANFSGRPVSTVMQL